MAQSSDLERLLAAANMHQDLYASCVHRDFIGFSFTK
jgi:hypothetical protein